MEILALTNSCSEKIYKTVCGMRKRKTVVRYHHSLPKKHEAEQMQLLWKMFQTMQRCMVFLGE